MAIINRSERRHYINTGTHDSPVWSRIGRGFSVFSEKKNPISYSRRYLHDSAVRTDVVGYASEFDYEFEVHADDPAIALIMRIADGEMTGDEAKVELLSADMFDESASGYAAVRRKYSVFFEECGYGVAALSCKGSMKASGEAERGRFDAERGIFALGDGGGG